jgi:hypothetical protein
LPPVCDFIHDSGLHLRRAGTLPPRLRFIAAHYSRSIMVCAISSTCRWHAGMDGDDCINDVSKKCDEVSQENRYKGNELKGGDEEIIRRGARDNMQAIERTTMEIRGCWSKSGTWVPWCLLTSVVNVASSDSNRDPARTPNSIMYRPLAHRPATAICRSLQRAQSHRPLQTGDEIHPAFG